MNDINRHRSETTLTPRTSARGLLPLLLDRGEGRGEESIFARAIHGEARIGTDHKPNSGRVAKGWERLGKAKSHLEMLFWALTERVFSTINSPEEGGSVS